MPRYYTRVRIDSGAGETAVEVEVGESNGWDGWMTDGGFIHDRLEFDMDITFTFNFTN